MCALLGVFGGERNVGSFFAMLSSITTGEETQSRCIWCNSNCGSFLMMLSIITRAKTLGGKCKPPLYAMFGGSGISSRAAFWRRWGYFELKLEAQEGHFVVQN